MNSKEESLSKKSPERRKFVMSVGVLSVLAFIAGVVKLPGFRKGGIIECKPEANRRTVKMLTEDGKLVEIDEALLASGGKKVSNEELQRWVKR